MHRSAIQLAALACCLFLSSYAAADDGFQPIFNGKDLADWEGEAGWWSVEDGAITGTTTEEKKLKKATYLFWRGGKPADFELCCQFRFVSKGGNSGINIRSSELPNWDVKGYQVDMETGPNHTGGLYEVHQRGIMVKRGESVTFAEDGTKEVTSIGDRAELQKHVKAGDWNQCRIVAKGPEVSAYINGVLMSRVVDRDKVKSAAEGLITIQLHPGPPMKVQFKDLQLKSLDAKK